MIYRYTLWIIVVFSRAQRIRLKLAWMTFRCQTQKIRRKKNWFDYNCRFSFAAKLVKTWLPFCDFRLRFLPQNCCMCTISSRWHEEVFKSISRVTRFLLDFAAKRPSLFIYNKFRFDSKTFNWAGAMVIDTQLSTAAHIVSIVYWL